MDKVDIDKLKTYIKEAKEEFNMFGNITTLENDLKRTERLIKEYEKIQKENEKLQVELNAENNRCMILANNEKFKEQVINLMANIFFKKFKAILLLEYGFENEEQLKEYFIELVKGEN